MVMAKTDFGTEILATLVYRKSVACDELYYQFRKEMTQDVDGNG